MEGAKRFKRTYKGESLAVLRKIADEHSYGFDEEGSEDEVLVAIKNQNGDGCDFIETMTINGKPVIEQEGEGEEETIEC